MLDTLRKLFRGKRPEPCPHPPPRLVFDWYRESGIATCQDCGEVFLAGAKRPAGLDWTPGRPEGGFDGF